MGYSDTPFAKILMNEQLKECNSTLDNDIRSKVKILFNKKK